MKKPLGPENRVEYIGFFTIRYFETQTAFNNWLKLPWYKRIFKF